MDPISLFAAIPKVALFLLLIVGGAIVAEIFYFGKKKEPKTPEVNLPPTPPIPETPLVETIPPSPPSQPPPPPPSPPKKRRLSRKTLTALLIIFFVAASIPAAVVLVKQRQEIRERAVECDRDCGATSSNIECWSWAGSGCAWQGNPYSGSCVCKREKPPTPPPEPTTPPEGCSNQGQPCDKPGYPSECCGSLVCDYNTCKPCSAFTDEARCWTHNKCYWVNGSCQVRPSGTPPPGTGNITCSGSSVKNDTNQTLNCTASYFTCKVPKSSRAECEANPFCGGSSSSTSFTLTPGASKSFPDSSGIKCGVWQNDFTVDCGGGYSCSGGGHGCNWDETCEATPPPTPTPTPPAYTAQCEFCRVYDQDWNLISDLSTLTVGQTVYLATRGSTTHTQGITKARFRITVDGVVGSWQETTDKHGTDEFYIQYTILSGGSYTIESMVYNPTLGWW